MAEAPPGAGRQTIAFAPLSEAVIRWHGASGNRLMIDTIVGSRHVPPRGTTFTGLKECPVAFIERTVPAFAFASRAVQLGRCAEATDIIHEMSGGCQPRNRIFVNVVHAVDGARNVAGRAMLNAEIGAVVAPPPSRTASSWTARQKLPLGQRAACGNRDASALCCQGADLATT